MSVPAAQPFAVTACSVWLADASVLVGRIDDARRLFDIRNDVGLMAEEHDTRARRQAGTPASTRNPKSIPDPRGYHHVVTFNPTMLLLSLVPSGIGFVLFTYGKKQERWGHMAAGVALMVYPYFVTTALQMVIGAAVIGGAFWWALQSGW